MYIPELQRRFLFHGLFGLVDIYAPEKRQLLASWCGAKRAVTDWKLLGNEAGQMVVGLVPCRVLFLALSGGARKPWQLGESMPLCKFEGSLLCMLCVVGFLSLPCCMLSVVSFGA